MNRRTGLIVGSLLVAAVAAGGIGAAQGPEPPAPELKKLEFLAGKSITKGKMYEPGKPPADWSSTDNAQWVLGGQFLRSTSKSQYAGFGTEDALEIFGYDAKAKAYHFWRFGNMSGMPSEVSGNFEGSKLVMTSKDSEEMVFRATWEPKEKGSVAFLLEMKVDGKFQKMLEGTSTPQK